MIEGIDVSRYNGISTIDWPVVARHVQFVYVKASDGVGDEDPSFSKHVKGARAVGLVTGAYHYLRVRHGLPEDAVKQANELCDLHLREGCELVPMLDCEEQGNTTVTGEEWLVAIRTFLSVIRTRLGVDAFVYTYPGFWSAHRELREATDLASHPLWIAHYTPKPEPIIPAPWSSWSVWQYAAGAGVIGRLEGVKTVVDRNRSKLSIVEMSVARVPLGDSEKGPEKEGKGNPISEPKAPLEPTWEDEHRPDVPPSTNVIRVDEIPLTPFQEQRLTITPEQKKPDALGLFEILISGVLWLLKLVFGKRF